jgi:hypothetical protein
MVARLIGEDPNSVSISLNKEFLANKMGPQELVALIKSYFDGAISKETLIYNLRKGDMLDPSRTDEDELLALSQSQGAVNGSQV